MRIVFMGTPEFAIPSLDILIKNKFNVVAVVTSTDKTGGRNKNRLIESDVKKYALSKNLKVLQPKNLKSPEFLAQLSALQADLQIVVAFRMLPASVWNLPPKGTFNLHGSLLPKFRGAAPINWAIIKGEPETGVTSFKLKHEIDTGDILYQETIDIRPDETAGQLHDRMKELAAQVVLRTAKAIQKDEYVLKQQANDLATKAPKIFREDCEINWDDSSSNVYNFIRGLSPYPTAWTIFEGKMLKIFNVRKSTEQSSEKPGSIITDGRKKLAFATRDGSISCDVVQWAGKKKMDVVSFLNGIRI